METTTLTVPDIGDFNDVEIIEILVSPGDLVALEDPLITLETDKATMDIPASQGGVISQLLVQVGDRVNQGDRIANIKPLTSSTAKDQLAQATAPASAQKKAKPSDSSAIKDKNPVKPKPAETASAPLTTGSDDDNAVKEAVKPGEKRVQTPATANDQGVIYASPSIRHFARELGVDLALVRGSGRKGRITKADVQGFIKLALTTTGTHQGDSLSVAAMPEIDFAAFGEIERKPLSKINKLSGQFLHRNWVRIPHVTQFDEVNITDLEGFRKAISAEYKEQGIRITLLAFLLKAVVLALKKYPRFNSSLDASGENLIIKRYFHIGIAVDTPDGLVVPVIRDVEQKSLLDLAKDMATISTQAREKKLKPSDMQGGCMSISSLGGIGGSAFTPIINAPEVAILGISRAVMKPIYHKGQIEPQLMLPLALSYDHRVIDGADGARFITYLAWILSDTRRLLL